MKYLFTAALFLFCSTSFSENYNSMSLIDLYDSGKAIRLIVRHNGVTIPPGVSALEVRKCTLVFNEESDSERVLIRDIDLPTGPKFWMYSINAQNDQLLSYIELPLSIRVSQISAPTPFNSYSQLIHDDRVRTAQAYTFGMLKRDCSTSNIEFEIILPR